MAKELAKQYDPQSTEDRIYQEWCDKGVFPHPDRPQQKALYHRDAPAQRHRPAAHGPCHG